MIDKLVIIFLLFLLLTNPWKNFVFSSPSIKSSTIILSSSSILCIPLLLFDNSLLDNTQCSAAFLSVATLSFSSSSSWFSFWRFVLYHCFIASFTYLSLTTRYLSAMPYPKKFPQSSIIVWLIPSINNHELKDFNEVGPKSEASCLSVIGQWWNSSWRWPSQLHPGMKTLN